MKILINHLKRLVTFTYSHRPFQRPYSTLVLGIESTFDDTGAAVVDARGNILGEALNVQTSEHVAKRGVDPADAKIIHKKFLPLVVDEAMKKANVSFEDLDAIATATRPGLSLCLSEGLEYTKVLVQEHRLPFIPIHHMEAHLLTPRMTHKLEFPFLTLLVSGGHCILCVANGLGDYDILGETLDEPPGATFDKVARSLQIIERFNANKLSNGKDLEELARSGDKSKYEIKVPLLTKQERSCDFSFSGLQAHAKRLVQNGCIYKNGADIAAWFQHCVFQHILMRAHRAIIFCKNNRLLSPTNPTLVISGGVTCNRYLRNALSHLCNITSLTLVAPPGRLCRDNGVMIAWAGMEYLKVGRGISEDVLSETYSPKSPLGKNIRDEVIQQHIKLPKTDYFINQNNAVTS